MKGRINGAHLERIRTGWNELDGGVEQWGVGAAALGLLVADNANDAHEVIVPIVDGRYIHTSSAHR